jgi:hypothetical protein
MSERKNAYKTLFIKPEGKDQSEDAGVDRKMMLEWLLEKRGGKVWLDASGSRYGQMVGSCEHGYEPSSST